MCIDDSSGGRGRQGCIYLLRGRGENPKVVERERVAAQRQEANAAAGMSQATAALAAAGSGGAAVVAHRNLEATARKLHPTDWRSKVQEALASISFDPATISSPRWGTVPAATGGEVEIFRDWVIYGQEAHDIDASTRGRVYLDGSVHVTSAVVPQGTRGRKAKKTQVVNTTHDLRTAQLHLTSAAWSMGVDISPDHANDARRLADQLSAHAESLKPTPATAADIKNMVDRILADTGQPPAEKLKALSNLRYDRLLSDEEFAQAKERILGNA